jgi:AAA+ superfamily predicted ATPase
MNIDPEKNFQAIGAEMQWLAYLIESRINHYFQTADELQPFDDIIAPPPTEHAYLHRLVEDLELSRSERIVLALALAPHVSPQVLDTFFIKNKNFDRGFTEFGGIKGVNHGGFLPTGETALFLLAGDDIQARVLSNEILSPTGKLRSNGIIDYGKVPDGEPNASGLLLLDKEYVDYLTAGKPYEPEMNHEFPAKRITTSLAWEDLVLNEETWDSIAEIRTWLEHEDLLMQDWGLGQKVKAGYRCLFYGPPGTGKTLTATLLGKATGMPVYRVDLSLVVSKYIGETEKNLSKVFEVAESKKWILFFDEADALFGKRVQANSSNDRFANQEVAFLLQRIEDFNGLVVLASNLKGNIDEAFARRFQSMIYFPLPDKDERKSLWDFYFNSQVPKSADIDFEKLAEDYEVTGGNIVNVLRYSCIKAVTTEDQQIQQKDIVAGLKREFRQLGKTI